MTAPSPHTPPTPPTHSPLPSTQNNAIAPQVIFVLRIHDGSFEKGFAATLDILEPGSFRPQQKYTLPPCPQLPERYSLWRSLYHTLGNTRKIQPVSGQTTQRSYAERQSDCKKATIAFEDMCLAWFAKPNFEALRRSVVSAVELRQLQHASILLDVNTGSPEQDILLRKLPWHTWVLFEQDLPRSEMILSAPVSPSNHQLTAPMKILAVFGTSSGGLQLNRDLALLEQSLGSKGAQLTLLNQPSPRELQDALWQGHWDMLFFAGHSSGCDDTSGGIIQLKDDVVLTLRDLKSSLNKAVENGLKLAIFNSCDGLSLADYLAARRVPISIVMREPVSDRVARYFLEYFLEAFSQGQLTLAAAVRTARGRLQWLESDGARACPAATWLPIIYQNPNQSPLLWPQLPSPAIAAEGHTAVPAIQPSNTQNAPQPPGHRTIVQPAAINTSASGSAASEPSASASGSAVSGYSQPASNYWAPTTTPPAVPPPAPPSVQSKTVLPSGRNHTAMSQINKWRVGALLLLLAMLLGKGISLLLPEEDYFLSTAEEQENATPPTRYMSLEERFSTGDREMIRNEVNAIPCPDSKKSSFITQKRAGIRAMRSRQYELAVTAFEQAWALCPSPEVLIYKNNALIGDKPSHMLAVSVPIDWPSPKNAIEMLRGAAQSQTLTNQQGGVAGVPVKLMVIDDGDKPEVAKAIATTLIDSYPQVLAVIGHWTSGVTVEAASVYDARRALVFMTPVSTTRELKGETGWVFRATINMRDAQKTLAQYAYQQAGYRSVATFSLDAARVGKPRALYSEGLQAEFAQSFTQAGGTITNNFDLTSPDFERDVDSTAKKMVRIAKRQGADAVMLIPDNTSVLKAQAIAKAASQQGLGLLGVTNLYREEVLKTTCPEIEGMVMTIAWKADGRTANPDFTKVASSMQFWRGEVNFATAMTYNATQAMVAAMRESPTRAGIHEVLNRPDFVVEDVSDAQGMRFDKGDRTAAAQLVKVIAEETSATGNVKCRFDSID